MLKVKDLLSKMENGAAHVLLWEVENGNILLKTIWYNLIDPDMLEYEIEQVEVRDYELRIGVKII